MIKVPTWVIAKKVPPSDDEARWLSSLTGEHFSHWTWILICSVSALSMRRNRSKEGCYRMEKK
jgi:hypothetical protein